jgi:hypothetical protein
MSQAGTVTAQDYRSVVVTCEAALPGQLPLLYLPTRICPRLRHLPCYSFRSGTAVDTPDKINIVPPSVNAKCRKVAAGPHSDEQRAKHVRETRDEIGYSAALAIAKLRTVAAWAPSLEQHAQHERDSATVLPSSVAKLRDCGSWRLLFA